MSNPQRQQLCVVQGCVIHEDKILLVRRSEPSLKQLHGFWELPGGKVAFGENTARAAEREVAEETGVQVEAQELLPFSYVAVRKIQKKRLNVLVFCYRCKFRSNGQVAKPAKIAEVSWAQITNINPLEIQSGSLQFILNELRAHTHALTPEAISTNTEWLQLVSVDSDQNRQRWYQVLIEARITPDSPFSVQLSWARIGNQKIQSTIELFQNRDAAMSFIEQRLATRYAHGYRILDRSEDFPKVPGLERFALAHKAPSMVNTQLALFQDERRPWA